MSDSAKIPLGKLLMQKGVISQDQLRIALTEQKRSNQPLGKLLIALGFVTEATMREALSENLNTRSADLKSLLVDAVALKLIPKEVGLIKPDCIEAGSLAADNHVIDKELPPSSGRVLRHGSPRAR